MGYKLIPQFNGRFRISGVRCRICWRGLLLDCFIVGLFYCWIALLLGRWL